MLTILMVDQRVAGTADGPLSGALKGGGGNLSTAITDRIKLS
jgi:hypothetical protein